MFDISRLSFIGSPLHFKHFGLSFGPLNLCLKFQEDRISGWLLNYLTFIF